MRNDGTETMNTNREAVNPITQGVIWKQLLLYFAPLLGASFLQLLYNTADTIIVGRFVGKTALTAVGGSAGQIYAMVTEFMIGMSGGAGVILSQAYGAKNRKLLDSGIHNAIALSLRARRPKPCGNPCSICALSPADLSRTRSTIWGRADCGQWGTPKDPSASFLSAAG